jgi:hypothetical protein
MRTHEQTDTDDSRKETDVSRGHAEGDLGGREERGGEEGGRGGGGRRSQGWEVGGGVVAWSALDEALRPRADPGHEEEVEEP